MPESPDASTTAGSLHRHDGAPQRRGGQGPVPGEKLQLRFGNFPPQLLKITILAAAVGAIGNVLLNPHGGHQVQLAVQVGVQQQLGFVDSSSCPPFRDQVAHQQIAGARKARHDGPHRHVQHSGDLLIGEAFQFAQDQRFAELPGKPLNRRAHLLPAFAER